MSWQLAVAVFIGGGLGALSRWTIGLWVTSRWSTSFPFGTLAVNLIGCLVLGLLVPLCSAHVIDSIHLRQFLIVGFLGGLTTFGTFSYETLTLLQSGAILSATLNIVANLGVGLLLTYVGLKLG